MADAARGEPVTVDTRFQAASVSKPFAAIAAVLAFDEFGWSLDDDVNDVLASLRDDRASEGWLLPNPYDTPVTMRMLLSHIGGTNNFHYSGHRDGVDPIPTMRDELDGAEPANTPAIEVEREPGITWAYSPAGFTVTQAIIEDLYDRPFDVVMDELLLDPLGLDASTFAQPAPSDVIDAMAVPYLSDGTALPDGPLVFDTAASGGLTTTPTELAELLIAVQQALAGETDGPIPPELAAELMVRQPGQLHGPCFPTAEADAFACRNSWGLGFDVNVDKNFDHAPDGQPTGAWFGHTGFNTGYLTFALVSKTGGNGVVVMVNVSPADMSGSSVPQNDFLFAVVRRISSDQQWE